MKHPFLITLAVLCATACAAPVSGAETKPYKPPVLKPRPVASEPGELNILELTSAEMYRYGREMFLRGNMGEAAKVFLQMLKVDCNNKIAQYHLRKIADQTPSLAFLNEKLDALPCKSYDFSREDFLPASIYYEKDANIVLEQLLSYKKRYRLNEKEMAARIEGYMALVKDMETTVAMLRDSGGTPGPEVLARIEKGKAAAGKIEREVNFFRNQLASESLARQKELQDMRTLLAEAEASDEGSTQALVNAVARARAELADKERDLAEKDQAIMTLRARFDDIQRRLKAIQNDLASKNAQIQAIEINLQDTSNP